MVWKLLKCCIFFIGIAHGNEQNENSGVFMDHDSLNRIIRNISEVFQSLERQTLLSNEESYSAEIKSTLEKIDKQISVFNGQRDSTSLYFWTKNFRQVSRKSKNFAFLENDLRNIIHDVHHEYVLNKSINRRMNHFNVTKFLETLRDLNAQNGLDPSFFSLVSEAMKTVEEDPYSDRIPQPRQFFEYKIWYIFVSSLLKGFIVDVFRNLHYRATNSNMSNITENSNYTIKGQQKLTESLFKDYYGLINNRLSTLGREIKNYHMVDSGDGRKFTHLERYFQFAIINRTLCRRLLANCQKETNVVECSRAEDDNPESYEWITGDSEKFSHPAVSRKFYAKFDDCYNGYNTVWERDGKNRVCSCDKNKKFSRMNVSFISSEFEEANVTANMVVTGVRFVRKNGIIYTQIRQGELLTSGDIRLNSDRWKPIKIIEKDDIDYTMNLIVISHKLKSVNLDDLRCPYDHHVVTGVGLRVSKSVENTNRIVLTIGCHPVNFERGKILSSVGTGPFEDKKPHPNQLKYGNQSLILIKDAHILDSSNDSFVDIDLSKSLENSELSVLPWFETENVAGTTSVPLSGVGLYHGGAALSAGYLAYRLWSIDYSLFIFPQKLPRMDPYAKERLDLTASGPTNYCGSKLAKTLCIVCNASYAWSNNHRSKRALHRFSRSITEECCSSKCKISNLQEYCGPYREDISDLKCS